MKRHVLLTALLNGSNIIKWKVKKNDLFFIFLKKDSSHHRLSLKKNWPENQVIDFVWPYMRNLKFALIFNLWTEWPMAWKTVTKGTIKISYYILISHSLNCTFHFMVILKEVMNNIQIPVSRIRYMVIVVITFILFFRKRSNFFL